MNADLETTANKALIAYARVNDKLGFRLYLGHYESDGRNRVRFHPGFDARTGEGNYLVIPRHLGNSPLLKWGFQGENGRNNVARFHLGNSDGGLVRAYWDGALGLMLDLPPYHEATEWIVWADDQGVD